MISPKLTVARLLLLLAAMLCPAAASAQDEADQRRKEPNPTLERGAKGDAVLRAQVLLDRAWFSPGEIDASFGANMRTAVIGFQKHHRLKPTGVIDESTWRVLNRDDAPILASYTITDYDEDVSGDPIPSDMMEKAELDELGYVTVAEALGERFHVAPHLLRQLNPGKDFEEGETIMVPSVDGAAPPTAVAKVVVDKSDSTVSLVDFQGRTFAQFPATLGSKRDPLPIGNWFIEVVARDPTFHYNPQLFWDSNRDHAKATIPAGPNNPVGVVWIDLSREHVGIHGTPEPSNIGKTQSHGCIRMTNWSAMAVADLVSPGTPAILRE